MDMIGSGYVQEAWDASLKTLSGAPFCARLGRMLAEKAHAVSRVNGMSKVTFYVSKGGKDYFGTLMVAHPSRERDAGFQPFWPDVAASALSADQLASRLADRIAKLPILPST